MRARLGDAHKTRRRARDSATCARLGDTHKTQRRTQDHAPMPYKLIPPADVNQLYPNLKTTVTDIACNSRQCSWATVLERRGDSQRTDALSGDSRRTDALSGDSQCTDTLSGDSRDSRDGCASVLSPARHVPSCASSCVSCASCSCDAVSSSCALAPRLRVDRARDPSCASGAHVAPCHHHCCCCCQSCCQSLRHVYATAEALKEAVVVVTRRLGDCIGLRQGSCCSSMVYPGRPVLTSILGAKEARPTALEAVEWR